MEEKCELLAAEKTAADEIRSLLVAKVDSLTQVNEGLMIQVEILERDAVDRDKLIVAVQVGARATQNDFDWLLHLGLVRIVEKLIEHPDFTSVVSLIRHSAFIVGVESGHNALVIGVGYESVNPVANVPHPSPIVSIN